LEGDINDDRDLGGPRDGHAAVVWTSNFAYAAGLIATDGYLTDTNTVGFSSTDAQLVDLLERSLGRSFHRYSLAPEKQRPGDSLHIVARKTIHMARLNDSVLRDQLLSIGITRRKSLTLAGIDVPDTYLFDLIAGLLDGDGSVMMLNAAPNGVHSAYRLTRLRLVFYSGSQKHVEWLQQRLAAFAVRGSIHSARRNDHVLYHLVFSDRPAATILTNVYEDPRAPRLTRKRAIWERYLQTGRQPPFYGST